MSVETFFKKQDYENTARKYTNGASKLKEYSISIAKYLTECNEALSNIDVSDGESCGDVVDGFKDGVNDFKSRIANVLADLETYKNELDNTIEDVKGASSKYTELASKVDEEEAK